jgi:hypothetical protein
MTAWAGQLGQNNQVREKKGKQDNRSRTAEKGQSGQDRIGLPGQVTLTDQKDRLARKKTGQLGQNNRERETVARQPRQHSRVRKTGTRQLGQDNQDKTTGTGQP